MARQSIAESNLQYFDQKLREWQQKEVEASIRRTTQLTLPARSNLQIDINRRRFLLDQGITVGLLTTREVRELYERRRS